MTTWTTIEDKQIEELRAQGKTIAQISEVLTGHTKAAIVSRIRVNGGLKKYHSKHDGMSTVKPKTVYRRCMNYDNCHKFFYSQGAHHRLCNNCRHLSVSTFDI